jgi:hypothetical protein
MPHPTRLLTPICSRKRGKAGQVDDASTTTKPKRFINAACAPAERPQQNGASLITATLVDASAKAQAADGLAAREADRLD